MLAVSLFIVASSAGSLADMPHAWLPENLALSNALIDGNPRTYEQFEIDPHFDPVCFGLEFPEAKKIGCVEIDFASLGWRVYEPSAPSTRIEAKVGGAWKTVETKLTKNYDKIDELAKHQGRGWSTWQFRFEPLKVEGIRIYTLASANNDASYRCIVPSRFAALEHAVKDLKPSEAPYALPKWLEPGANLAVGGVQAQGTIRWSKPVLINKLAARGIEGAEYLAGDQWRPCAICQRTDGSLTFLPVATKAVRVRAKGRVGAFLDMDAKRYFEAVEKSRSDMLGERFKSGRQDLASMESLLLPIDFSMVALGRPADLHETMMNWAGLFWMVETSACEKPSGEALPVQALDRWFLPVVDGEQLAQDIMATESKYLDGWLPATVTKSGNIEQTVYVTAPGSKVYANIAELSVKNATNAKKTFKVGYAMGRRRLYSAAGEYWTPFLADPQPTGYTLDKDGQTVRNKEGEAVFWSPVPGKLGGTAYEAVFETELTVEPKKTGQVAFAMPSVDEPLKAMPELDVKTLRNEFKDYWTGLMAKVATIDIPEKPFNDLVKNLLAQCLIITLDGDEVRYGAYFYESYFGIEEGWPAVALAQYGFGDEAKQVLRTMLKPQFMNKGDYHHQYRNGLDPWYAIMIGRLLQDDSWLKEILPISKECADWTIKVIAENKDANWGGVLPKHIYGGDVGMPAYSFYSNATCWRELHDTAWLCGHLGETDLAKTYQVKAESYRTRLNELADKLVDRSNGVPFLPMSFDLDTPSGHRDKEPAYPFLATRTSRGDTWGYVGNYWNLFAPTMMEVRLFDSTDERSSWIPDYMRRRGGLITGMARFDAGYDAGYSKGYIESLLQHGRREDYLTSLYGILAHGMSRNLLSSPEVSGIFPLRIDNLTLYREYERYRWNPYYRWMVDWISSWQSQEGEPTSAGPGMALQLIRSALVREDFSEDPTRKLLLLDGAPSHWFEKGKRVAFKDLRTFFGLASLKVECRGDSMSVEASLPAVPCRLRLPHPSSKPLVKVTVDGKDWTGFKGDEIELPNGAEIKKIEVKY